MGGMFGKAQLAIPSNWVVFEHASIPPVKLFPPLTSIPPTPRGVIFILKFCSVIIKVQ